MADKEVATEVLPDGNSRPVQPSQPTLSAAPDVPPSDPNLVSKFAGVQARVVVLPSTSPHAQVC